MTSNESNIRVAYVHNSVVKQPPDRKIESGLNGFDVIVCDETVCSHTQKT